MRVLTMTALLFAAPFAFAQSDLQALSDAERAAFRAELRAYLLAHPEVVEQALTSAQPGGYAAEAAADRDRIAALAARLFDPALPGFGDGPVRLALLTGECADCGAARTELEALARTLPLRVYLVEDETLGAALGLDALPSYVFEDLMVRGHVPPVVIERYVRDRAQ
ncbi:hypothetical protein PGB28_09120 [Primorskyibacter aestuariivivens]|uniref:hypothetical protein n=1 Tax=Primorskyibacter aestuariivivens TaxID=1888912 RepID=UPI002301FA2C|nr:hypothetical protein [Primorskyibacter aestuariivivens]MDA7428618.1 hypothetical protein [Primorskyibacter aestuariivivens]